MLKRTHSRLALRATPRCLRMFGVGVKDSERHREAKYQRALDTFKLMLVTGGVMFCGVWGMSLMRSTAVAINPKGSSLGMKQRMDEALFSNPHLALALSQMALHHALSGVTTPFGAPMVAPPHLAKEAEELELILFDLMTYKHDYSPADLWALMSAKALRLIGGPDCVMKAGRPLTSASMKVQLVDTLVSVHERDAPKLKNQLIRRGYRVSDIVALVGAMRSLGYHPDSKVKFDAEKNRFVSSLLVDETHANSSADNNGSESAEACSDPSVYRKTTTHPFMYSNDYFDALVQYEWRTEASLEEEKKRKKQRGVGGFISSIFKKGDNGDQSSSSSDSASSETRHDLYRCDDKRKAALRVKYAVRYQGPSAPQTKEESEAEAERLSQLEQNSEPSICSQISMQAIDVSLLDDTLMNGWVNRYADNEQLFFVDTAKLLEQTFVYGYNAEKLHRTHGV